MGYSVIKTDAFAEMQFNAGVLLRQFNIDNPVVQDADIICATNGGFNLSVVPSLVDTGDGVYMMQPNTAEMMKVEGWTVEAEFTCIGFSPEQICMVLGAATVTDGTITPALELQNSDFSDLWWLGDRTDGGFVAVNLKNALSEDGFELQTEKNASGGTSVHLVAHTAIDSSVNGAYPIPVDIYSIGSHPIFWVENNRYLMHDNTGSDVFAVNEATGMLNITENGNYHYIINTETGRMEVSTD